jgi:hypothetical protein
MRHGWGWAGVFFLLPPVVFQSKPVWKPALRVLGVCVGDGSPGVEDESEDGGLRMEDGGHEKAQKTQKGIGIAKVLPDEANTRKEEAGMCCVLRGTDVENYEWRVASFEFRMGKVKNGWDMVAALIAEEFCFL